MGNDAGISLYPNPNTGEFNVSGTAASATIKAEVVNMLGQVVFKNSFEVNNGKYNMHIVLDKNLPSGLYTLRLNAGSSKNIVRFSIDK